ncbi:g2672 [Coccomyxa elongata]
MAKKTYITFLFSSLLKGFSLGSFLVGIGFITFGCVLQSPPKNFVPGALVAIGCFTIVSSAIGYFGSQFRPVFLSLYLVVGTFATTLQLMLVLGIFGAQDKVADEIEKADSISGVKHFDKAYLVEKLEVGKWIFLWVVLAEAGSLVLAMIMRCMGELQGRYEGMEAEEADQLRAMEIQSIKGGLGGRTEEHGFGRLAGKMNKKYGKSSHVDFYEGQRWYNIFNK